MVNECRFVKPNGLKCGAVALRGSPFCYFHARNRYATRRTRSGELAFNLPSLSNPVALQDALNTIFVALGAGTISSRRAGSLLYALQLAQKNLESMPQVMPEPNPTVASPVPAGSTRRTRTI
jgi:hypothetical protein